MSLQALMAPLMARRCFIAYKLVPQFDAAGNRLPKDDKLPIDPRTGKVTEHTHDPAIWMTGAEILATGLPVAIVLSEATGVFCIDLDGALQPNGQWSEFSTQLCRMFPGAAVEVSTSQRSLHIFGTYNPGQIGPHRCSSQHVPGLEIYTRLRFIALTGWGLVGSITTDCTATLAACIAHYFPDAPGELSDEWTTDAYPGFRGGTEDDNQLIQHLCNSSGGARAVFGDGVHFRDLWNANAEVLARAYPSDNMVKGWNYSAADQALANHLAFYTGFNCERTQRLMWGSALRRDKWEREDYMQRTVLRAVAGKRAAAIERARPRIAEPAATLRLTVEPPAPPEAPDPPAAAPMRHAEQRRGPGAYMTETDQCNLFNGCTYIRDINRVLKPDGTIDNRAQFDVDYGGYEFQMSVDGTGATKSAWEAFTMSRLHVFPKAEGLYFDPTGTPGAPIARGGLIYVNSWQPVEIIRVRGDVGPFMDHLERLLPDPNDRAIMLAYMAFCVQYPGVKADWCPLLQGVEGNGKTFLSVALQYCIGQRYTHWPVASNLGNHFNAEFYGKLLICVEDIKISEGKESLWEALKPMITGKWLTITPKGVDGVTREICFNFMLNSNHKDAVRKTRNDRRIAAFFCPQQHDADLPRYGMSQVYFQRLWDWAKGGGFACIFDFLMTYKIEDQLNPAVGSHRAPITSSTEQAIRAGRGAAEQEVMEAIEEGRTGFRGGWISSIAVDELLAEMGRARQITREKRRELIETLGYRLHPELKDGRPDVALPNGQRPRLYITRQGHESEGRGLTSAQIGAMYHQAQVVQPVGTSRAA